MKTNEKDTEQGVVPALRFPEFLDAGAWEGVNLGKITYKVSKKNKAGKLYPIYSINNKQGFIRHEEQFDGVDGNDRGYDLSLYNIVGSKTFAYNPARINVGSIGYSGNLKDVIISSLYVCFQTCKSVNDEFLLKYFETESFNKAVSNSVEGGIRSYLFYDNFAKINLFLPPNYDTAEQQKIAECLSSIDALIKATKNKIDELKAHKKGLMQRLFPAEGKTVPEYRFPEFQDTGEWVYLEGDKVFEPISNRKHSSNLPVLAISQEHGAIPRDLIDYNVIVSESGLENYKVVEVGDFIISLRSFQGGIEYSNYKGICSPAYIILRKRLDVDNQFFKCYFKSRAFIRDLNKNLEGIRDGKMVSFKQFSEILLPIPSIQNKKEQQKIAECLSTADDLILAQTNRLEALKTHKKGLMQQLFPNINDC